MPLLRHGHPGEVQDPEDSGGTDIPPAQVLDVLEGDYLGADALGYGEPDRLGAGVFDPALSYLRADAERRGRLDPRYSGDGGFSLYLKEAGILSGRRSRMTYSSEVTGANLDR